MNPTTTMLRWYRQSTSRAIPQQQYTAQEVLRLLRPNQPHDDLPHDDAGARIEAVRQAAARPSTWLSHLTKQQRWEIGRNEFDQIVAERDRQSQPFGDDLGALAGALQRAGVERGDVFAGETLGHDSHGEESAR